MVITDNDKSLDLGSDIERLAKAGIAVKMDRTTDHMHHKFMVARSAAKHNHENILVAKEEDVVKSFLTEFEKLWKQMSTY